ncbi:MAG TPA: tetratricopeptide repeat protein [Lacipirellulaceae bacterium]|nr:tetratricopeptide repeat protein [Lacipirellulaceae bacterium]
MLRTLGLRLWMCCFLLPALGAPAIAKNEGQADLDKATQLKVTAETLDDLGKVIDHADTALEKGLDKENAKFARQLLIGSLLQRGQLFAAAVFNVPAQDPQRGLRAMQFRQFALSDLQRVVAMDDKAIDAQLLIGKLQSLPFGDPAAARRALSKVIDSTVATPDQKAEAYALRSTQQKDDDRQLADLNKAVELAPKKPEYLRLRAQHLYEREKFTDALADIDKSLKMEPNHFETIKLRGMILLGMEKYDDALANFDKASKLAPENPLPYELRGEVYRQKGDLSKAVEQLNKALELAPESIATLLVRAGVFYQLKQPNRALEDIDAAIRLQPNLAQSHLMRAEVLAATNRLDQAIDELEHLLQAAPGNVPLLNQLGSFYLVAGQPHKAIETATKILSHQPDNFTALRIRADACLNIGNHAGAIADFERALALKSDDESLLNNFAWVLATSPDEKLRDGPKALKLATKAAESSKFEVPHILSTLAAAYAETGDFKNAAKWSQKSVELAQKALDAAKSDADRAKLKVDRDQLKKELESYHHHKPVRERQTASDTPDAAPQPAHAAAPAVTAAPARTADF